MVSDPRFVAPGDALREDAPIYLWWLGQAGFAIRRGADLLLIDPYLSDTLATKYAGTLFPHTRLTPPPVMPEDIEGVQVVLCTHAHTDHMDPGTIVGLLRHNDPLFVVPRSQALKGVERGIPSHRLLGVDARESIRLASGITVTAVPASHEDITLDDSGQNVFLGYVLDIDGYRIYHSGDCVPYAGQAETLAELDVDLALLPVNGRDEYRTSNGVPGNFHCSEAVDLCRRAGIPVLLCHHWGLFDFNTVDPRQLKEELSSVDDVRWILPEQGTPLAFGPALPRPVA